MNSDTFAKVVANEVPHVEIVFCRQNMSIHQEHVKAMQQNTAISQIGIMIRDDWDGTEEDIALLCGDVLATRTVLATVSIQGSARTRLISRFFQAIHQNPAIGSLYVRRMAIDVDNLLRFMLSREFPEVNVQESLILPSGILPHEFASDTTASISAVRV